MPRAIWTGALGFGLVSIPVRVYPAVREHDVRFHQVAPDGSRIRYKRVSDKTGREVDYGKIRLGYEITQGKMVTLDRGEIEELQPPSTRNVDIHAFVDLAEIDPVFFDRTYYLAPNGEAARKPYALLASVMEDEQRVGVGNFVMREKQYLAAIRPYAKGLALSTMRFADEIVPLSQIDAFPDRRPSVSKREKELANQIVRALDTKWDPADYHDTYQEELVRLIRARAEGETVEVEEPEEEAATVVDLMDALRASLDRAPAKRRRSSRAQRPARTRRSA